MTDETNSSAPPSTTTATPQSELPLTPAATESAAPADTGPVSRRDQIAAALDAKPDTGAKTTTARTRKPDGTYAAAAAETAAPPVAKERKYPSSWKPDYKPVFEEIAANEKYSTILDEIERREGEYHKGIEPYKESASFAQNIRQAIKPYEATLRSLNVPPEAAIGELLKADHILRSAPPEQKHAYLLQIAANYGIDLSGVTQGAQQVDPYQQALNQRLQQQEQMLNQFLTTQQRQDAESANQSIQSFRKDHEHLDDVRQVMADLIDKGLAKGLDDAYDQAIWLNPDIRAKVIAKQQSLAESKRKEAVAATVNTAKSAAVQVKGAPSTGNSANRPPSGRTRREIISKMMND